MLPLIFTLNLIAFLSFFIGKMDTIDVFDILKRNGLYLALHLVKLLKQLGYNNIYTLIQIESPEVLRKIIDLYGSTQDYLTEEEIKHQ